MLVIKVLIYTSIFLVSATIGVLISKKYVNRLKELMEFKNALNVFKTKIKFTYSPIPEVFTEISRLTSANISNVFEKASSNMSLQTAGNAWVNALNSERLNIYEEDKEVLKNLSKLLGKTDVDGQVAQIELTSSFLDEQILKAKDEKSKNEKMSKSLGMIFGIAIVIILM